jgi:hypothetical protein
MIVALKLLIVVVWVGAGVSKFGHHFTQVVAPMVSNSPCMPSKTIKRWHYGADNMSNAGLTVAIVAGRVFFPILGNLRSDLVSFLPSMRQYAGNWASATCTAPWPRPPTVWAATAVGGGPCSNGRRPVTTTWPRTSRARC